MPRVLQVLRVTPTKDGWQLCANEGAAAQEKFPSKHAAISAGVRLALAGGYLLIFHEDGSMERLLPFCKQ